MNKELEVTQSIMLEADTSRVWDALTNPEKIKQYLYGTDTSTDWQVGSEIIFQGEWEGKIYKDKGVILANEPNKFIQYSYWSGFSGLEDTAENYAIVTYRLVPNGEQTILSVTQAGFANEQSQEHSISSWASVLQNLKKIV